MQRAADTAPYMRTACITRALEASHQPCGCAGNLMHNPLTRSSHLIVCLLQTDIHSPSATVFEALLFSATLRLERNVNERTQRAFAEIWHVCWSCPRAPESAQHCSRPPSAGHPCCKYCAVVQLTLYVLCGARHALGTPPSHTGGQLVQALLL